MENANNNSLKRDLIEDSHPKKNTSDICYSAEDVIAELKDLKANTSFRKEVPFRQGPYLDAPFSKFPNFYNGPA